MLNAIDVPGGKLLLMRPCEWPRFLRSAPSPARRLVELPLSDPTAADFRLARRLMKDPNALLVFLRRGDWAGTGLQASRRPAVKVLVRTALCKEL